jgi:hypothetical protein
MTPLRARRVPPRLSLVPAPPVTRPGPGLKPVGLTRTPLPFTELRPSRTGEMMIAVEPGEVDAVAGRVAGLGAGGVVARPGLFGRLGVARVTVVSAPAGSGKTVLLRSWISHAGLGDRAAFVAVWWDPQRFWLSVVGALRRTSPGSELVQAQTTAPGRDGWALVVRLLKDLAPLPAGADTTVTRAGPPSRSNKAGRATTPPATPPAAGERDPAGDPTPPIIPPLSAPNWRVI